MLSPCVVFCNPVKNVKNKRQSTVSFVHREIESKLIDWRLDDFSNPAKLNILFITEYQTNSEDLKKVGSALKRLRQEEEIKVCNLSCPQND